MRRHQLTDPVTTSYIGAMYAMFELEKCYNMQIAKTPDDQPSGFCITADFKNEMYPYMEEWYKAYTRMQSDMEIASSEKERKEILDSYHNWQWTYPKSIVDSSEKDIQKARLKKKIEELQEAYDKLDKD